MFNMYAFDKAGKIEYINHPVYDYRIEHIKSAPKVSPYNLMRILEYRESFFKSHPEYNTKNISDARIMEGMTYIQMASEGMDI